MIRRIAGLLVASLIGLAYLVPGVPAAHAQTPGAGRPLGAFLVIPGDSIDLTAIRLRTSAGCPREADAYYARMTGQGFPDGVLVTTNTSAGISHTGGFDVYLAQTMRDFADLAGGVTLGGRYDITVSCIDSFRQNSFGEFTGALEFVTPTSYVAIGSARPVGSPPEPLSIGGDGAGVDLAAPGVAGAPPPGSAVPGQPPAGQASPDGLVPGAGVERAANSTGSEGSNALPLVLVAVLVTVPIVWVVTYRMSRRKSP